MSEEIAKQIVNNLYVIILEIAFLCGMFLVKK